MKYHVPYVLNCVLASFLAAAFFHIGFQNLDINECRAEMNMYAEDVHVYEKKLGLCIADLEHANSGIKEAIEKAEAYCRG